MYKEQRVNVRYIGYFAVKMPLLFFLTHLLKVIYNSFSLSSQLTKSKHTVMFFFIIIGITWCCGDRIIVVLSVTGP